jgi:hypothetical protein
MAAIFERELKAPSEQFGAAYLAEGAQRIDRMAVHQLCDSGNVLFGAKYVSTIVRTTTSAFSTKSERDKTPHSVYPG